MNPLYKYSLDCGFTPSKPDISVSFFPMSIKNYIIIENCHTEKEYEHIDEISSYLTGVFKKNSIRIIQLKFSQKDKDIFNTLKYQGLSLSQANFLIKNAKLILSNSRYTIDSSNALKTPALFLTNERSIEKENPYWYNTLSESLNSNEYAENICSKILKILKIDNPFERIKPFFSGKSFGAKILEVVPNFNPEELSLKKENINLRADIEHNNDIINKFILSNSINLICKKIPDLSDIPKEIIKSNLIQINLEVTKKTKQSEINNAKKISNKVFLFCRDENSIKKIRLKFINEEVSLEKNIEKKDLDICNELCDNTYYKSSKIIISKGKNYTSTAAMKQGKELNSTTLEKAIDCKDFWAESEHFKLLNLKNG